MQNTAPVNEDGRVLVSAIKDGYNAYLTYTEQLLKLHNENMARLLSDAVAINPWWSPKANETLGEWADLYVSSVESTIDWVRRMQESRAAPIARIAREAVQVNERMQDAVQQTVEAGIEAAQRVADAQEERATNEPANDARLLHNAEQRGEEPREDVVANDDQRERREETEPHAPASGRRGQRAGGERQR